MSGFMNVLLAIEGSISTTFSIQSGGIIDTYSTNNRTGQTVDWFTSSYWLEQVSSPQGNIQGLWPATFITNYPYVPQFYYVTGSNSSNSQLIVYNQLKPGSLNPTGLTIACLSPANPVSSNILFNNNIANQGIVAGSKISTWTNNGSNSLIQLQSPLTTSGCGGIFTASASSSVLTVSSIQYGTVVIGAVLINASTGVGNTKVGTQISGTTGGAGTYNLIGGVGFASQSTAGAVLAATGSSLGSLYNGTVSPAISFPSFGSSYIWGFWNKTNPSGQVVSYSVYVSGQQAPSFVKSMAVAGTGLVGSISRTTGTYGTVFTLTLATPTTTNLLSNTYPISVTING